MKSRHHTDGVDSTGETTVLLTPVSVPRLCAGDVIATYLALRCGLWVDAEAVRKAALSHGIGLDEFAAAAARMITAGEIDVDGEGAWREGTRKTGDA
jgi:hypothetical protein